MSEEGPDFCKAGAKQQQQDNLFLKILNLVSSKVLWFLYTVALLFPVRHSKSQKKARLVLRNPVAGFTNKPFSYISFLRSFQDASMLTP